METGSFLAKENWAGGAFFDCQSDKRPKREAAKEQTKAKAEVEEPVETDVLINF